DSKTSYAIEGEGAPQNRIQRWGRAIGEAGKHLLDLEELLRLQRIVIGDARFVKLGLRREGSFVGTHDRDTHMPLPDHISARPDDLSSLMAGIIAFAESHARGLDAVIAAAILAFGFVYVHPFEDGNGRIHRYLIHHVLARREFNPPGLAFPVSAAILRHIDRYRGVLEDYSRRLLPVLDWEPTVKGNVQVKNDTADFYRFFDVTPHAEFLYDCVRQTIETDLPLETGFLRRYDEFRERVQDIVDMPDRTVDLLFRFLRQNDGRLSRLAHQREFAELIDEEVSRVEKFYAEIFR
ncbi:MAG: Fic family protein, partial [Candidatus Eisenbacteria sp.]|nr:Fic family protein [Candidatus Eisenbacteria bacterium]